MDWIQAQYNIIHKQYLHQCYQANLYLKYASGKVAWWEPQKLMEIRLPRNINKWVFIEERSNYSGLIYLSAFNKILF